MPPTPAMGAPVPGKRATAEHSSRHGSSSTRSRDPCADRAPLRSMYRRWLACGTGALPLPAWAAIARSRPTIGCLPIIRFRRARRCVATYRELLRSASPKQIGIVGLSAGGGLAAAHLKARDLGCRCRQRRCSSHRSGPHGIGDTFATTKSSISCSRSGCRASISCMRPAPIFAILPLASVRRFQQGFCRLPAIGNARSAALEHRDPARALRRSGIVAELHVWEAMPLPVSLEPPDAGCWPSIALWIGTSAEPGILANLRGRYQAAALLVGHCQRRGR